MYQIDPPEVLTLQEVEKSVPNNTEVLIQVFATTVNYGDLIVRNFRNVSLSRFEMPLLFWLGTKIVFGIKKPRKKYQILGNEFSGIMEAVGKNVILFKPGDKVFGYSGQSMRAYAEYIVMSEEKGILVQLPTNMSYEEAAVVLMGAIIALNLLKRVELKAGQYYLINGASGEISLAAV